jgi:pimeloyl-ACP methyl ester carboxylesterase
MNKCVSRCAWLVSVIGISLSGVVTFAGDEHPSKVQGPQHQAIGLNLNVPTPTLGGRQFWADLRYFHDWRIQQNLFSKHCRLLDRNDIRQAWGTLEQCETRLEQIREERNLPEMKGEAVILVHGIGLSSKSFSGMRTFLQNQGYPFAFSFDYPSTRVDIQTSAEFLHQTISSLRGIERIHFVTHSLGGLIVRQYLARYHEPRVGRLVMLGTPNHGANLADWFRLTPPYYLILGPAGQQLGANADSYVWKLPVPRCEFGVIAGGRGPESPLQSGLAAGFNPLIPGDDDTLVSVHSALLEGATDSLVLPILHIELPCNQTVKEHTARFLRDGRFRPKDEGPRQPVLGPLMSTLPTRRAAGPTQEVRATERNKPESLSR